jgi:hypothetical protein
LITVKITGLNETLAALDNASSNARAAAELALYLEGERIMGESKGECPVDTGALRSSGNVVEEEAGSVTLNYPLDYAVYVHENMEAIHPTGKAKFLEDPVNRALPSIPEKIGAAITAAIEGSR